MHNGQSRDALLPVHLTLHATLLTDSQPSMTARTEGSFDKVLLLAQSKSKGVLKAVSFGS